MKKRTDGFLAEDKIAHDSEIFNYIKELHGYLWRFVLCQLPWASGYLGDYLDTAIESREHQIQEGIKMKKYTVTKKEIFDFWSNFITIIEDEPNEEELDKRQFRYIGSWLESIGMEVKDK